MQDLKRIRFVTANYSYLQGLKWVPYGIWVLLLLASLLVPKQASWASWGLILLITVGAILAILLIQRYYNRAFGRAQPSLAHRLWEWGFAIVGGVLALAAFWLDVTLKLPVNLVGLTCAAAILCDYVRLNWYARSWFRGYALMLTLLVAGASWLPALGVPMWPALLTVLALMGVVLVALGVLDHRLLVQTMKPAAEVSDGPAL
jgi:hypothetical protein